MGKVIMSAISKGATDPMQLDPILNNNSWAKIRYAADNNLGESVWAVGDAKQITLNGTVGTVQYNNYQPWVYILGFNHNSELEGNNLIHFGCFRSEQNYKENNGIVLDDSFYGQMQSGNTVFHMNSADSSTGGWKNSSMRLYILNSNSNSIESPINYSLLKNFPLELKNVLKQCVKYTDNVGGGQNSGGGQNIANSVTSTLDWFFLLSEFELFGKTQYSNTYESNKQKQYQYYINGNSKNAFRQSDGASANYWLRSPVVNQWYPGFCKYANFGPNWGSPQLCSAFAPAFCV